jgi:F-box protein 3
MGLESVGDLALNIILTKLGPKETVQVLCVSKKFKDLASEESLWSLFCRQDLDLSAPLDHHGNRLPSFKVIYDKFNHFYILGSCWFFYL